MTPPHGTVHIGDKRIGLDELQHGDQRHAHALARAKAEVGHAWCLCTQPPQKLVIRCRGDTWHLARWPGGREQHHLDCAFRGTHPDLSGRPDQHLDAITEHHDTTHIRLNTTLHHKSTRAPATTTKTRARTEHSTARGSVSLLGLLHYLWEESQLHTWQPRWNRTWGTCYRRLAHHSRQCTLNDQPLDDIMWLIPPYKPNRSQDRDTAFAKFTNSLDTLRHSGLILGQYHYTKDAKYGHAIHLRHHGPPIYVAAGLMKRLQRSYPAVFTKRLPKDNRIIGIWMVDRTPKGNWQLRDAALMPTTPQWIPVDSSHELTMAAHLNNAKRHILKPLRYDKKDTVFPDFVLTDTTPHTYVEVYGVHGNQQYDDRKRRKQHQYRQAGHHVIEWHVHEPLPDVTL